MKTDIDKNKSEKTIHDLGKERDGLAYSDLRKNAKISRSNLRRLAENAETSRPVSGDS